MRYEVLCAVYHAASRYPCIRIDSPHFLQGLGIWRQELERHVGYLEAIGFLAAGDEEMEASEGGASVTCITQRGIDYIQHEARRRRTVRGESARDGH